MDSKIASFPSVVAAKKAAVTQLSYYRAMMGTEHDAGSPTSTQARVSRSAKAAAVPQKPAKK